MRKLVAVVVGFVAVLSVLPAAAHARKLPVSGWWLPGMARVERVEANGATCTTRLAALLTGSLAAPTVTLTVPYIGSDEQCVRAGDHFQNLTIVVRESRGYGWLSVEGEGFTLELEPGSPEDQQVLAASAGVVGQLRALEVSEWPSRHLVLSSVTAAGVR